MEETKRYIQILIDSLAKKERIMQNLYHATSQQEQLIKQQDFSMDDFQEIMELKEGLLKELEDNDEGFQVIYERVHSVIEKEKQLYVNEIKKMQQSISAITQKSVEIQALEQRNKVRLETYFSNKKKELREGVQGVNTTSNYYKVMSNTQVPASVFLDQKK